MIVRLWILLSAWLVGAGWILSACHELNRFCYGVVLAVGVLLGGIFWRCQSRAAARLDFSDLFRRTCARLWRRCKRPLPLFFLVMAIMTLLGALLYFPMDGDAFAYRTPRVLHWLWHEQWHWIRGEDKRINIANCGFEWLTAPLLLFSRTDRWFFVINWISYLLLPGLIFSVFNRLGVRRKVAWWWMWLLASGWCYVMQAGSIHNDSMAVIYALAAIDLALRAREKPGSLDAWLSGLAIALLTGVKQTNIPLALLWVVAIWPSWRLFLQRPLTTAIAGGWALLVSFVPMMIMNLHYTGRATGIPATENTELHSPFWGIVGNSFCLPVQNLMPPFFPWAERWDAAMRSFLSTPFGSHFSSFEKFGYLRHSVNEETAGIGLGICGLILISLAVALWHRQGGRAVKQRSLSAWLLLAVPWFLLAIFMAKVGTFANARQLAPYYPFLVVLFLILPVQSELLRRPWWRYSCYWVMLATAIILVLSRSRPLFPAQTLIAGLEKRYPGSKSVAKLKTSYFFVVSYVMLRGLFHDHLPADGSTIGYLTLTGTAEPGLALPLGRLEVERLMPEDGPAEFERFHIHYIVADDSGLAMLNVTAEQWAATHHAHLITQQIFIDDPYVPHNDLYLFGVNE